MPNILEMFYNLTISYPVLKLIFEYTNCEKNVSCLNFFALIGLPKAYIFPVCTECQRRLNVSRDVNY